MWKKDKTRGRFKITKGIAFSLVIAMAAVPMFGKKKGYKLTYEKESGYEKQATEMARGSFMVASHCTDCNQGYKLDQISFSGYDKPQQSAKETFFITNNTDRAMTGVTMYVEYLTTDGSQLNKRFVRLSCNIPPGETRIAELTSWDKQKSFYYVESAPSKRGGTPYKVVFDPISYYLRF